MPRNHNRILRSLVPLIALALSGTACGYIPIGEKTESYEIYHDNDAEPWCAEGESGYVLKQDSILQGPHFSVGIQCRYTGETLPHEVAERASTIALLPRAEKGSEFIANHLTTDPESDVLDIAGWEVRSWVQIGDREFDLDAPPQRGDWIVVTAPTDVPAVLWVEDDGRAQGLDLRTGERIEPVFSYYTNLAAYSDLFSGFSYEEVHIDNGDEWSWLSCQYDGGNAWRSPWTEELGWAPEGSVYLGVFTYWCRDYDEFTWNLDQQRSITLASGEAHAPIAWYEREVEGYGIEVQAFFLIPDIDSEVTIEFEPVGEIVDGEGDQWQIREPLQAAEWVASF